jgi:predicted transcriptional regulator
MPRPLSELGRRERQIMDAVFRRGQATAAEVHADLPDPPSYSSVRAMLRILEQKGFVQHEWDGPRHVFRPVGDRATIRRSVARHVLQTFFDNSMETAVAALLGSSSRLPSEEELDRLSELIEQARRKRGRS